MTSPHVRAARRNAYALGATGVTVGALFLFPTSTNRTSHVVRPAGAAAPAGIVGRAAPRSSHAIAPARTVNGSAVDTPYGPVQVQLRIRGHQIVSAAAIAYPMGTSLDQEINSYAIPLLQKETVAAQSARIDSVSGATYTSQGYVGALQSALDAAHL